MLASGVVLSGNAFRDRERPQRTGDAPFVGELAVGSQARLPVAASFAVDVTPLPRALLGSEAEVVESSCDGARVA